MKKAEIIIAGIAICAFLMSFFLIPGGGILLVISLSILIQIYLALGFAILNGIRLRNIFKKESYKELNRMKIIGSVFAGIALASVVVGILYKLMMWPGSFVMLRQGLTLLLIILVVVIFKKSKSKSAIYTQTLKRIVVIGGIGLIIFVIPQEKYLEFKYRNHPGYVKAMKEVWKDPKNPILQENLKEEREKLFQSQ